MSSGSTGSGFNIGLVKEDGSVVTLAKVDVPQTGDNDWSKYKVVTGDLKAPLEAGQQVLRITINAPYVNLDKLELKQAGTGIKSQKVDASEDQTIYNLYGMKVDKNNKGIMIKNGKKIINK